MQGFSYEYLVVLVFTAISFFTFMRLLSGRLYLNYHRMLPIIACVITFYNFYMLIMPVVRIPAYVEILTVLAQMCSTVTLFLMFFYLLELRNPKYRKEIQISVLTVMIAVSAAKLSAFITGYDTGELDLLACFFVLCFSIIVFLGTKSQFRFDEEDKKVSQTMIFTLFGTIVAYFVQYGIFKGKLIVSGTFYAVVCILYYNIARTNRIEDAYTLLRATLYERMKEPAILLSNGFYMLEMNEAAKAAFSDGEDIRFMFEDEDTRKKCNIVSKMVERASTERDIYVKEQWHKLQVTAVSRGNMIKGYIVTATDVTDKYAQLDEAKTELRQKGQFMAVVSRELRSPLQAVIGMSDILMKKQEFSSKNRGFISHIRNSAESLMELIETVLDYSRLETGTFAFVEKTYSTDVFFSKLACDNIINLRTKDVELTIAIITEMPKLLYGDPVRVYELLQNLVHNAIKYTDHGSIRMEVGFYPDGDKCHVEFSIADTGIGMTPDEIERFFPEDGMDAVMPQGTSFGFVITRQLLNLMLGSLHAESDGVSGTRIYGDFYQDIADSTSLAPRLYDKRYVMNKEYAGGADTAPEWVCPKAKFLVVDDQPINQAIYRQLFANWRAQVDCANDGTEALSFLADSDYQIVFVDRLVARDSGLEIAQTIRKEYENAIIILACTTFATDVENAKREGILDEVWIKPLRTKELRGYLERFILEAYRDKDYKRPPVARRRRKAMAVYRKNLENFIRELEPIMLQLPKCVNSDHELFGEKISRILDLARQIDKKSFADQVEIIQMAIESEHWDYIDAHFDEFMTILCDVIEEVTEEHSELAPDLDYSMELLDDINSEDISKEKITEVFEELLTAFKQIDITRIERILEALESVGLEWEDACVLSQLNLAYENLDYETGQRVLEVHLKHD